MCLNLISKGNCSLIKLQTKVNNKALSALRFISTTQVLRKQMVETKVHDTKNDCKSNKIISYLIFKNFPPSPYPYSLEQRLLLKSIALLVHAYIEQRLEK